MMHTRQDKPQKAAAALKFFNWAYTQGDAAALHLDYVPMPKDVKAVIAHSWSQIKDASGKPIAMH
jgi:phosphate transport system substrate-binding protein